MDRHSYLRKGIPLTPQSKEIVWNTYQYLDKLNNENKSSIVTTSDLVVQCTGVKIRSVQKIIAENKRNALFSNEINSKSLKTKSAKRRSRKDIDDFDKRVIRRLIHNFHLTRHEFPTLKKIHEILKKNINYSAGLTTLRKHIRHLGFRWRKTKNNKKILMEKFPIRLSRLNYLTKIAEYRAEGRPIVYTDETYLCSLDNQISVDSWTDSSLEPPTSKANRLIIVHAGGMDGFVPNALLMFIDNQKTDECKNPLNFENYDKWICNNLIPNLKPNTVVVVRDALYLNRLSNTAPNSSSRKQDMINWLNSHGISYNSKMFNAKLYEIIAQHKHKYKQYKIDDLLNHHGHTVLRLPPYHPELNPFQNIWEILKKYVAQPNLLLNMENLKTLSEEKLDDISTVDWKIACQNVIDEENKFPAQECYFDDILQKFDINVNDSDSDDDESLEEDGEGVSDDEPMN